MITEQQLKNAQTLADIYGIKLYICDVDGITEIWNVPKGIVLDIIRCNGPDLKAQYVHGLGDQVRG